LVIKKNDLSLVLVGCGVRVLQPQHCAIDESFTALIFDCIYAILWRYVCDSFHCCTLG